MLTPEDAAHLIEQMGLDKPLTTQYMIYVKNFFTGNLGFSFHYGEPVARVILSRLPCTLLLFTTSTLLAALAGIFLGKLSAWNKGSRLDGVLSISALVCHTLFVPWFALMMLWVLGFQVGWFPLGGIMSPELWIEDTAFMVKVLDVLHHMLLPLLTLFIIHVGSYLLLMRSSMLSVLKEDYILDGPGQGIDRTG